MQKFTQFFKKLGHFVFAIIGIVILYPISKFFKGLRAIPEFFVDLSEGLKSLNPIKKGSEVKKPKKRHLAYLLAGTGALAIIAGPFWLQLMVVASAGIFSAIIITLLCAPLMKEELKHDPDNRNKIALFVEVQQGRSVVIIQGGNPRYVIEGGNHPPDRDEAWLPWWLFQRWVFWLTGLHTYVPFFTKPHTYPVPRYELNKAGKEEYRLLGPDDKGYWSNHVRTEPTTWHFKLEGVEIEKIPFTITGFVLIRIIPGREIEALFDIDSWSEMLNEAIKAIVRNFMRANVTLDQIQGSISKELWDAPPKSENPLQQMDDISYQIKLALRAYKITSRSVKEDTNKIKKATRTLEDFGIDIQRLELTDPTPELSTEERRELYSAVFGREKGRGRALSAQGDAHAEKLLIEAHKDGGEASQAIIQGQAFVNAVRNSNVVETLLAALARKQIGG